MSEKYIPLYRKYRPKNLAELVGQEHVKKALKNAINLNKASHAYLFTGPRGTGKTSVARILAKSLNCKEGPTLIPCEVCASCMDIKNSTPIDVIEIDAASNRKVEDTQTILEKIQYIPVNGKYKIYIIDEVHMLTNHAFNALLKTLEEPPENVIFILATTEPQKVLETITSRCQRFDFRRITTDDIINHLTHIAKAEKINIDSDALFTIAKNSSGGMRDSLALLDQVSVLDASEIITADDVNKLLGRISFDLLHNLSQKIIKSNPQEAIEILESIYNSGNEPSQILVNMLEYFKNLLIIKNCQKKELLEDLTQLNSSQINTLQKQSEHIDSHQITFLTEKTVYYIKELKSVLNQHLWLEVAIIDLANLIENTSLLELQERISRLENAEMGKEERVNRNIEIEKPPPPSILKPLNQNTSSSSTPKNTLTSEKIKAIINNPTVEEELSPMPISKVPSKQENDIKILWTNLLQNIPSPPTISLLADHSRPIELSEDKIVIGCEKEFALKMIGSDAKKKIIMDAAKKLFNKEVNVIVKLADFEDKVQETEKKKLIIEHPVKINPEFTTSEKQAIDDNFEENEEFVEHELSKLKKKNDNFIPSDQVSMVMNLFDGKYID
jgi:DNA polymerase-3 subunit gamma/tau